MKEYWTKKIYKAIVLCFMLLFSLPIIGPFLSEYQLNPFDYARITDVEYKAVVQDEPENGGSLLITERLTYDIHAASSNNTFWELWRDLSEDVDEGLKVDYTVHSVKQILPDGSEIVYEESPVLYWEDEDYVSSNKELGPGKWYHSKGPYNEDARQYECVFFYIDDVYRDEMVFEIVYEMHNASMRYADCSELYVAMYSGTTVNHLDSFKADILFPAKDMPANGNYEASTYGTSEFNFPFEESDSKYPGYHTFSIDLDKKDLKFAYDTDYLEFDLFSYGDDKHIFTNHAPDNSYSNDPALDEIYEEQEYYHSLAQKIKAFKVIYFICAILLSVVVIVLAYTVNRWIRLKHYFFKPTEKYQFYREIPDDLDPNFAAEVVFSKLNKNGKKTGIYPALLLSLVRKKYIAIEDTGSTALINVLHQKQNTPPQIPEPSGTLLERLAASGPIMQDHSSEDSFTGTLSKENILLSEQEPVLNRLFGVEPIQIVHESAEPTFLSELAPEGPIMADHEPLVSEEVANLEWDAPFEEKPQEILEPLTPCEESLFDLIIYHAYMGSITLSELESSMVSDYDTTETFSTQMEEAIVNIGIDKQFYQKLSCKQPAEFLQRISKMMKTFALLILIFGTLFTWFSSIGLAFGANFILAAVLIFASCRIKKVAHKYILYTQHGEDECAKWVGLYNFLNSDTLMNERTYTEVAIWEKYLVYATAFGISEKVINAINIRCPEVAESPVLSNDYYRTTRFRHSGHSFHRSVRVGTRTARSSYGDGFGGGSYGGGGRGGGGGCGGH